MASQQLTPTSVYAEAGRVLEGGGFSRVSEQIVGEWEAIGARVFEDRYCIVGVVVYETSAELVSGWPRAQAMLVELMTRFVGRGEPKAWEGYLALFTPARPENRLEIDTIRRDTTRVRKFVTTGEELKGLKDIERALLPLLPLSEAEGSGDESALEILPRLLERHGVAQNLSQALIDAFEQQRPLMGNCYTAAPSSHEAR